ncbi:phosphotransferase enzyme family protein [Saccharopolyspora hordei]|uniref:Spectinomycin phosphotransferase n=1 Tax=Saccharopolyspora hordei TaxID=1838 RepID=A0A853ANF4_9PSEU|nr:spectinomycin phosphotransferase [Saccharopolyspora hordei]
MEHLPERWDDGLLLRGLEEFGIRTEDVVHLPVGFGDHHWRVTDVDGRRWFVTVADLERKWHCGRGAREALRGVRRAMGTAAALREDGLDFVVAPIPAASGELVVELDDRYGLSVFPHVDGETGEFGQALTGAERDEVIDLLARLHTRTPPPMTPRLALDPWGRDELEAALDGPWSGGPFAEPAGELLAEHADHVRARLAEFDRMAARVQERGAAHVVTHGEPHPGNLLRTDDGYRLVDWDTAGLAVPERDLSLLSDDPADLARYGERTGRAVDAEALALHRLRWTLMDLAEFVAEFRRPHTRPADLDATWEHFTETLRQLAD